MVVALDNDGPGTLILDSRAGKGVKKVKNLLLQADRHTEKPIRPDKGTIVEREGGH